MTSRFVDRRRRLRAERGFTLVEIMVVVVIIGLLATLVAQNVLGQTDEAKLNKAKSDLGTIKSAMTTYLIHHSTVPDSLRELIERGEDARGPYLDLNEIPKDPWDNEYEVRQGERRKQFVIVSYGPDGYPDTDDDITTENMRTYTVADMEKGNR